MRRLKAVLFVFALVALSLAYAGASEVRQQEYTYAYEFAKDTGRDTVFVICDACQSISRLVLRPKEMPLAIKVIVPEATLRKTFPNVGIDGFRESEVKGLYEVTAGNQIFYFSPEGYLIFGEIWSKEGRSLTAERRTQIISEKVKVEKLLEERR